MTEPLSPAARAVLYDAHNRWLDVVVVVSFYE